MNTLSDNTKILSLLKQHYPKATIALKFSNTWELLVAVVLSAQCTDKRVNIVTENLFKKYKSINDYASAEQEEFEQDIRSTGFFRNKAKHIITTARKVLEKFDGKVPDTMEELISLPGVARKTANIILGNGFNKVEGIAVDTHVKRLSERLGLSENTNPDKIEQDLMKIFNKDEWFRLTYFLIEHGRAICDAKKPKCNVCFLSQLCPSAFQFDHLVK